MTRLARLGRLAFFAAAVFFCSGRGAPAQAPSDTSPAATNNASPIDLPTVLRLAGAQSLDVQIARARLNEAQANRSSAVEQFFPWLAPGVGYHRRDGMAQAVPAGTVSETHLQSYAVGGTVVAQLNLGDAIYQSLAAQQLLNASGHALEAQLHDSTTSGAQAYFDLLKAQLLIEVVRDAVTISEDYQRQLHEAVAAGIAFKGDELRVQTQTETYQIALRQAFEAQRTAAANLARTLHLNPAIALIPQDRDMVPLTLFSTNAALDSLVRRALNARPELKQSSALVLAAHDTRNGAVYGPLVPSLNAQVFAGGFGGGHDDAPNNFGNSEDYLVGLSWRIGPGGLFDFGRVKASKARLTASELANAKLKDAIVGQVVTALSAMQSLSDQIFLAQRKLATAGETLKLTRDRKQFGVGIVLEDIQAQQELTKARSDYLSAIADFNKAQYALNQVVGNPAETGPP